MNAAAEPVENSAEQAASVAASLTGSSVLLLQNTQKSKEPLNRENQANFRSYLITCTSSIAHSAFPQIWLHSN